MVTSRTDGRSGATESAPRAAARGFSLMELVLVILIVAIISAVVVPRFGGSITRHRADTVAQRIAVDLELARRRASTTSAAQRVIFDVEDDSYELDGLGDMDHSTEDYIVSVAEDPYKAVLVFVNFGGDEEIIFDGFGTPDSGGSVIVQVGNEIRTVTVDANTGETSVSGS